MTAEPPAQQPSPALPTLCTIDFSAHALLRQASTMLRRVWLVDPPLTHEELADPPTVAECLRSVCEAIGSGITDEPADEPAAKWDHARWLAHTQLKLLDESAVVSASAQSPDLASVVSPWREDIYDIYRHVFSDLFRALVRETPAEARGLLGRYDPVKGDAVSLVVLPALEGEEEQKVDKTAFTTDTFLYPVWVNPKAKISFSADGTKHVWEASEEATWTVGLWVHAGRDVALVTEMEDAAQDKTKIAAVFVTGHCEERGAIATTETPAAAAENTTTSAPAGTAP
ncbi:unnamed protein product [Discula destructiva]